MRQRENEMRPNGSSTREHSPCPGPQHPATSEGGVRLNRSEGLELLPAARVSAWVSCLEGGGSDDQPPAPAPRAHKSSGIESGCSAGKSTEAVPRFSVQRSTDPFVFRTFEVRGSLPVCYFCFTTVHSHSIIPKTALAVKKKSHTGGEQG